MKQLTPHEHWFEERKTKGMSEMEKPAPIPVIAKPKIVEVFDMQAVYGLLIHPGDGTRFDVNQVLPHERDRWTDIQIEAGKLKIV